LHTRRKDAENRLRGAESNLVRVQDVVQAMQGQISGLKRQASQAVRYRSVSGDIRQAEASLLFIKWKMASEEVIALEAGLREAELQAAAVTGRVAEISTNQAITAAALPPLRSADAAAAAKMQRFSIEKENLESETERRKQTAISLRASLEQISSDREREQDIAEDAETVVERLTTERARLDAAKEAEKDAEIAAREALDTAAKAANEAEAGFDQLSEHAAQSRARRSSLESDKLAIARRSDQLKSEQVRLDAELKTISAEDIVLKGLKQAEDAVHAEEVKLTTAGDVFVTREAATADARAARNVADAARSELQGQLKALSGEVSSLEALLAVEDSDGSPVANELKAKSGYEVAAGAAFGEEAEAGQGDDAARYWQKLEALDAPAWPAGVMPLANFVTVPEVLDRRLAYAGMLDEGANGAALSKNLHAGQILVDQAGTVWRWDGFVQKAGAPSQAAIRLEQKNRSEALQLQYAALQDDAAEKDKAAEAAVETHGKAREAEQAARDARQQAERILGEARRAHVTAEQEASKRANQVTLIEESATRVADDLKETQSRQAGIEKKVAELPINEVLEKKLTETRAKVEALRSGLSDARGTYDGMRREAQARNDRLAAIAAEAGAWNLRVSSANKQVQSLNEREKAATEQLAAAEASPEDLERRKQALLTELAKAEEERKATSDALMSAEANLKEADAGLKAIQDQLIAVRERQIRADAAVENATDRRKSIATHIGERFECAPTQLLEKVELDTSDSLPDASVLESRLEKLKRERDRMGAANLRADDELTEITEQMDHLVSERVDLEEAISRLRQAIGGLNREGRERLLAAFEIVNTQFGELFSTLFGGGNAYLELTESDDPLDAGLEIYASPPGKRVQALSLLSGGEQALTALSLIFAVFITNPAPLCVLDEVDAPLDDANVDRFCNLLENMISRTDTRFLIVTHNAVSMSRMNRLFGVTMAERGISTLVSVDLERAEDLLEAG
ncbi:MAG: hypothetical protein JKY57_00070, partial [Kordiimonadaceae bacterium]|nr:hypothetical protein [Kordiimonadaceae bacterium]